MSDDGATAGGAVVNKMVVVGLDRPGTGRYKDGEGDRIVGGGEDKYTVGGQRR